MSSAKSDAAGPPPVAPVPAGDPRPFWSVVVPTFNCAAYLRETLASVLAQDPGPDRMQVEVVDDASTKDDPEAVVREHGGRVGFYRHPANVGAIRNFNACVERSRGEWVHVLHGDDRVLPGFYREMEAAVAGRADAAVAFCRAFTIDGDGRLLDLTPRVPDLENGGRSYPPLHAGNPVQTPTAVVRRAFYEQHGGFDPRFPHVADWEMWLRATTRGGAVAVNRPLAEYRVFAANDTGRLAKTADNLRDYLRLAEHADRAGLAAIDWPRFRRYLAARAAQQAETFARVGDEAAAAANWNFWREVASWGSRAEYWGRRLLRGGR